MMSDRSSDRRSDINFQVKLTPKVSQMNMWEKQLDNISVFENSGLTEALYSDHDPDGLDVDSSVKYHRLPELGSSLLTAGYKLDNINLLIRIDGIDGMDEMEIDRMVMRSGIYLDCHGKYLCIPMFINIAIIDELVRLKQRTYGIRRIVHDQLPGTYLDIPIVLDFFLYQQDIPINKYTQITYSSRFSQEVYIMQQLTPTFYDLQRRWSKPIMNCVSWCNGPCGVASPVSLKLRPIGPVKFLFIMIYNKCPENEERLEIVGIEKDTGEQLDPCNFWLKDYPTCRVYAISLDPDTVMCNWVNVLDEYKYGHGHGRFHGETHIIFNTDIMGSMFSIYSIEQSYMSLIYQSWVDII